MGEEKKDENEGKVIVEARMHCQSCRNKVYRAIIGYPGVEDVKIDIGAHKVIVNAPSADAKTLFETMKKKSGGKVTKLVYPDPKDLEKKMAEEKQKEEEKKRADVTVELKVQMHCAACTKKVEKVVWKIGAVQNVKVDGEKVIVKGKGLDPKNICDKIIKKTGKHAEVIPSPSNNGDKKE